MIENHSCSECGATLNTGMTCETNFHQMLFWEAEDPANGILHHLTVLCYYMQHPSLYSPEGLATGKQLLTTFVKDGRDPADVRKQMRSKVADGNRNWKITARPGAKGAYAHPPMWTIHGADVVRRGIDTYCNSVRQWANSVYESLQATNNLV